VTAWLDADPFGDPIALDWDAAWRLHAQRTAGRGLDRKAFRPEVEAFLGDLAAAMAGDGAPAPLVARATKLALDMRWRVDQLDTDIPAEVADAATVARIAVDIAPSLGNDGPGRIVGPWAEGLDAAVPADRAVLQHALAAGCFVEIDEDPHERTPYLQWVRRKPRPSFAVRDTVRPLMHAVPGAWRVADIGPEGWIVEDLVGVAPGARPDGPVRVTAASVQGPAVPGDLLLARIVRTKAGWVAPIGFTLRGCPPRERVAAWVRAESWVRRLGDKLPSLEGMLREWPHTLWRRAHEWAWVSR